MRKLRFAQCLFVAALAIGFLAPAQVALANTATCPHISGHLGSTACDYNLAAQFGVEDTFQYATMAMSSSDISAGYHINNTLWGYGTGCGISTVENDWVEVGYTLGFHKTGGYHIYWATVQFGNYGDGVYANVTADGSYHVFDVYGESNNFAATLDGRTVVTAQNGLGDFICQGQAGLEVSLNAFDKSSTWANTFVNKPLRWEDSSLTWHGAWPSTSNLWIDRGCGSTWKAPDCLNGIYYSTSYWADNKPS